MPFSPAAKLALTIALCAQPIFACDFCAVYSANEARSGKGFYAGVAEQFTHFATAQDAGKEVPNPIGQYLDSSITQLLIGYNFNERFGVQFNAPMIYRSFKRPEGFTMNHGTESGLGDVSLVGKFIAYQHQTEDATLSCNLLGGVKFPTGSSRRIKEEVTEVEIPGAPESGIHGHDLTLGSGSFDGIIGASVYARQKRAFFSASAQYNIRSEGDFHYQFADDLSWSGGPGALLVLSEEFTLALQANVSGETKARDTFRGAKADDTGVTSVYVGPELSATWREKLSAELGVDVPVSISNTAFQIVPDYRIHAAMTWHF
jgi:hypothetical protein